MHTESKQAKTCAQLHERQRQYEQWAGDLRQMAGQLEAESGHIERQLVAGRPAAEIMASSNQFNKILKANGRGMVTFADG